MSFGVGVSSLSQDESGELVCTAPFPSMPTHFWGDEGGSRYSAAYFDKVRTPSL